MLQGKIIANHGEYFVELLNGESFKVPEDVLSSPLKNNGAEVNVSFSLIGEKADNGQTIDLLNHLLQIS